MQHLVYGNGLVESRSHNANYQVENITAGTVLNLSYTYGPQGNILSVADNINPGYGHVVSYDMLDRMLTSSGWYGVYSYEYDATGSKKLTPFLVRILNKLHMNLLFFRYI